jgi:hypothetical protein
VPVVAALFLLVPAAAQAAWTSSISGNTVTFTEDGGGTPLTIGVTGGNLSHNLAGQPGFFNAQDFDTFNGGENAVPNNATVTVNINGASGNDFITIGSYPMSPVSLIAPSFNVTAGTGTFDILNVADSEATAPRTVGVTPSSVTGFGPGISHANFDQVGVYAGDGNDVVNVAPGLPSLDVGGGRGDDRFVLAEGAKVRLDGGAGSDTIDFSQWTSPVTTNAPVAAHFRADLDEAQEVTPSSSTATGRAFFGIDLLTGDFDLFGAEITGITPAQENGSYIQLGGPGAEGSIIFDLETTPEPDAMWAANPGGMILFFFNSFFPLSRVPDLVTGNTYMNIRTTNLRCGPAGNEACANGEIRGQLLPSDIGFTAEANTGFFNGIENFIGGAAGDSLTANPLSNVIDGGPGADTIRAAEGADFVTGGGGADDLGGGDGDDRVIANDGEADTSINCGPGADVADRDFAVIDPDAILVECETVNTTAPVGAISALKAKVKRNRDGTFTIVTGAAAECPFGATADCALTATAKARVEVGGGGKSAARKRKVTLGRLKAKVAPTESRKVRIKLSRAGSRRLAANDPLRVNLAINLDVPSGQPVVLKGGKRLKAPKPRPRPRPRR